MEVTRMDLIRAYACGLLPDRPAIAYDDETSAVQFEALNNILGLTESEFTTIMRWSAIIVDYTIKPTSMRKLCTNLLTIYEEQGGQYHAPRI